MEPVSTHRPVSSTIRQLVEQLLLLVIGLVTVSALFSIAVATEGMFAWTANLVVGAGLVVVALRVPVEPRARVLAWLVAGAGVAMVVLGVVMIAVLLAH